MRLSAFRLGGLAIVSAFAASTGCANVIGLDGLEYDRAPTGSGGGSASGGTGPGGGGEPGSGGSSGSAAPAALDIVVTKDEYFDWLDHSNGHLYRFDETAADEPADDALGGANGIYIDDATGGITLGEPGVFADGTAVSFSESARMRVTAGSPFAFSDDNGAFTLSAFVRFRSEPVESVTLAECRDPEGVGWSVTIGPEGVFLFRDGIDEEGSETLEVLDPFPFPFDDRFHLLTVTKLSAGNDPDVENQPLLGYLDGVLVSSTAPQLVEVPPYECVFQVGSDGFDGNLVPFTVDEMLLLGYGINDTQIEEQIACLEEGACHLD